MSDRQLQVIQPQPMTFEAIMARAVESGVPVETMERLLAMRREINAEEAKKSFDNAMRQFQAECPIIKKRKVVLGRDGKPRFRFAPIEYIMGEIRPLLEKHGFSQRTTTAVKDGWVKAICTVTHKDGHAEPSEFEVPVDSDAYMSAPQKYAAALSFARRYAVCAAFGITVRDEDDENQFSQKGAASEALEKALQDRRFKYEAFCSENSDAATYFFRDNTMKVKGSNKKICWIGPADTWHALTEEQVHSIIGKEDNFEQFKQRVLEHAKQQETTNAVAQ